MKRKSCLVAGVLCLVSVLLLFGSRSSVSAAQDAAPDAGAKTVCPLSDEQETAAPKAFAVMTPTFQHPRCMNCHGIVHPRTGTNHIGGPQPLIPVIIHEDGGGLEPPYDRTVYESTCHSCHNVPNWRVPEQSLFFTGKDSVQLCKQMKRETRDASAFMDHIAKDIPAGTPFIQVSFEGTAALNYRGKLKYARVTGKDFEPDPPPISHGTFIQQAQAWIDSMGGKFRGDDECGCAPQHYSLSIDMQSDQGFTAGSIATHTTMSSHADIPLKFKDDGSFEADVQVPITITGYERGQKSLRTGKPNDCTITGTMMTKYKVKGTVDEAKAVLHLVSSSGTFGGSSTAICSDGTNGTTPSPSIATPGTTWDIPSTVDVDHDFPMPGQNPPQFTSSMKFRIKQTD